MHRHTAIYRLSLRPVAKGFNRVVLDPPPWRVRILQSLGTQVSAFFLPCHDFSTKPSTPPRLCTALHHMLPYTTTDLPASNALHHHHHHYYYHYHYYPTLGMF